MRVHISVLWRTPAMGQALNSASFHLFSHCSVYLLTDRLYFLKLAQRIPPTYPWASNRTPPRVNRKNIVLAKVPQSRSYIFYYPLLKFWTLASFQTRVGTKYTTITTANNFKKINPMKYNEIQYCEPLIKKELWIKVSIQLQRQQF